MSLEIVTLQEKHLEDAAALVCARYKALRECMPIMSSRYEEVNVILPMLDHVVKKSPGVVALQGSRLVGFLSGLVMPKLLGERCAYSPEWANGVELEESRRAYDEIYARLSAQWVADGWGMHAVTLLANDCQGIESWQWLGFGFAGVDGIRALNPVEGLTAQVEVRQAGMEDVATVSFFVQALEQHMTSAPIFWIHDMGDCREWLNDPAQAVWLAHAGQEAMGCMAIGPANSDACAIIQDNQTASITMAFTRESARNKGVARALLNRSLEWARSRGYERCAVDFETMNFLASRFWRKCFEPVCYSLTRHIDERMMGHHD
jgi:GNAT superfamily N-acetyltransferase